MFFDQRLGKCTRLTRMQKGLCTTLDHRSWVRTRISEIVVTGGERKLRELRKVLVR
jgi:hypothetical protein